MRSSVSRVATTIVIGMLVVACAPAGSAAPIAAPSTSTPPTSRSASAIPTVMATPAPLATPEPSRAPTGWPYTVLGDSQPVIGPDGTVYHLASDARGSFRRSVVALDSAGHMKPGWPIAASTGSVFETLALGPDGSVYIDECGGPEIGCVLHRLGADGQHVSGWPYGVPEDFGCPAEACYAPILGIGPSGSVYAINRRDDELRIIAIDPRGQIMSGWPIMLDDYDWSDLQLGSDGTLFAIRRPVGTPTSDPSRGNIDEDAELWAFGSNGKPRSGWPVPVPNIGRYLIGPQGDVVVWSLINDIGELCSNPRRTVFTVVGSDGRTRPGWPRGSTGFASFPALGDDGTLYYMWATHKVYAHDRAGEIKTGWPVEVPGAGDLCGPETPSLAPDGTIYVMSDKVTALAPDGQPLPGWPYRPVGSMVGPCSDTECYGGHASPDIAADGTVYITVYPETSEGRPEVVAIDRLGQPKLGWHYPLDTVNGGVSSVSSDGRIFIRAGNLLLALDPDGSISD